MIESRHLHSAGVFPVHCSGGQHYRADRVRTDEPAGILERGRDMGWILQEPGRSCVRPADISHSGTGLDRDQAQRSSPPHGSELGEDRLERRSE